MKKRAKRKFLKSLLKPKKSATKKKPVSRKLIRTRKQPTKQIKETIFLKDHAATSGFPIPEDKQSVAVTTPYVFVGPLPSSYNETKLVLMVRDPFWAFSYWDFSALTWSQIQNLYQTHQGLRSILRVYDVTDSNWNGSNAYHRSFDLDVFLDVKNWYIELGQANREWIADLGLLDPSGRFYVIARSNRVRTPRDEPSDVVDEEWMIEEDDEEQTNTFRGVGSSFQGGRRRKRQRVLKRGIFSAGVSSFKPH